MMSDQDSSPIHKEDEAKKAAVEHGSENRGQRPGGGTGSVTGSGAGAGGGGGAEDFDSDPVAGGGAAQLASREPDPGRKEDFPTGGSR